MRPIDTTENLEDRLLKSAEQDYIKEEFKAFIDDPSFPCVAAKAALNKDHMKLFVAGHLACPKDDAAILDFIYDFVDNYRKSEAQFHTACVIFPDATGINEATFESFLWMRLQSLSNLDAKRYGYDQRVSSDPQSENFSFSLKEEAFFVIGLHADSSRQARRFNYPVIVFNPHDQFEELRYLERYDKMKNIVRKKDVALSGSINPMLQDFGTASEVYQYSGMKYDSTWQCPFKRNTL
ncbi:guanitoxin biosynthesis heme-dependent pre-guanitoxin N-hydroxylase GntA [Mucilaginibacter lacusdianchii]|uniref:guanitoxin biosynthesis heme-dependent pre-guanitoxin N-hydroxylase GntA n=1 Tax=Mucilaginibacter lacusdianchii TaxID=2684211 RepID=UPI00131D29F0|nr:guanitoxin biosynthesis heme-dependent pre-guanitoxin N-hydroxylase GntA [Mucilaginibacter sp. JXJ CY 39]